MKTVWQSNAVMLMLTIYTDLLANYKYSHARVARLVDNNSLPGLIHIVVHPEVGSNTMQQHTMIRSHLRKLLILVTARTQERF